MRITKYDHELITMAIEHFDAESMMAYSDSFGWELLDRQAIDKARTLVGKYQTWLEQEGDPYEDVGLAELIEMVDRLYRKLHATLFPVEVKITVDAQELQTIIHALEMMVENEPTGQAQGLLDRLCGAEYGKGRF